MTALTPGEAGTPEAKVALLRIKEIRSCSGIAGGMIAHETLDFLQGTIERLERERDALRVMEWSGATINEAPNGYYTTGAEGGNSITLTKKKYAAQWLEDHPNRRSYGPFIMPGASLKAKEQGQ